MAGVKRVLVAGGTAIATSTVVAIGIEEAMKQRGIKVVTRQCKASEIKRVIDKSYDLVVTTTPVPSDLGVDVPVIQTLAFLTGIGKEEILNQIEKILKD